jgi:hypothetical protein
MLRTTILASAFGLSLAAAGCTSSELARNEGVTGRAGDAIAADTVLQMVDPWPRGVENTRLSVPADHAQYQKKSGAAAAAPAAGGSSSTDN